NAPTERTSGGLSPTQAGSVQAADQTVQYRPCAEPTAWGFFACSEGGEQMAIDTAVQRGDTPKALLTPREVAELIGWSPSAVHCWLQAGHLPGSKFGTRWYVRRAELEAWLAGQKSA